MRIAFKRVDCGGWIVDYGWWIVEAAETLPGSDRSDSTQISDADRPL